jgi:hypothetical protein
LAAGAALGAGTLGAAERDWCRDDRDWRRGDRYERYCEVREERLSPRRQLRVDAAPNGGIEVVGWDRHEIQLEAKVVAHADSEDAARRLAGQVRLETGDTIRAEGPDSRRGSSWSVSYRLHVPTHSDLALQTTNGGVSVRAIRGELDLETTNGGLHLEDIGGALRGRTTNGGVHLRLSGREWEGDGADIRTTNGGVKVQVPEDYNARLETGTTNGGIQVDFPVTVRGRIDRRLSVDLGRGGAPIRVFTTNGGVSLQRR